MKPCLPKIRENSQVSCASAKKSAKHPPCFPNICQKSPRRGQGQTKQHKGQHAQAPLPPWRGMPLARLPGEALGEAPGQVPSEPPSEAPDEAYGEAPGQTPSEAPAHGEAPGEAPGQAPSEAPAPGEAPGEGSGLMGV